MIENVQAFEECSSTCTKCLDDKLTGSDGKRHIVLCGGTGCLSSNSMEIKEKFEKVLEDKYRRLFWFLFTGTIRKDLSRRYSLSYGFNR